MPVVLPLIKLRYTSLGWQGTVKAALKQKEEGEFIVQVTSKKRTMTYYVRKDREDVVIKSIAGQSIPKHSDKVICCKRCKTPLEFPEYCYSCR